MPKRTRAEARTSGLTRHPLHFVAGFSRHVLGGSAPHRQTFVEAFEDGPFVHRNVFIPILVLAHQHLLDERFGQGLGRGVRDVEPAGVKGAGHLVRCHGPELRVWPGGQPTQATDEQVVELVAGLGVPREHIRLVEPTRRRKEHTVAVIRHELAYEGLSVIVARRACVTYAKEIKALKAARGGEIEVVAE